MAARTALPVRLSGMRLPLLVVAVWLPAHDLVYLAGHGIDELSHALSAGGHDPHWAWVVLAGGGAIGVRLAATGWRWLGLRRRLDRLGGVVALPGLAPLSVRWPARAEVMHLWLRLVALGLAAFVLQENLERDAAHAAHAAHLPLLGLLVEDAYLAAGPVFGLVGLLVATVASAVALQIAALERAVRLAERWRRADPGGDRPFAPARRAVFGRRANSLATPDMGRAPPLASTS